MSEIVQFAFRRDQITTPSGSEGMIPNLAEIAQKLASRDLQTVLSFGGEHAFMPDGVEVASYDEYMLRPEPLGKIALSSVAVIFNRLDRSIKMDQLPAGTQLPPMINENATRTLGHYKIQAYQQVLKPLGLSIPTELAKDSDSVQTFLSEQPAPEIVVKPAHGMNGAHVSRHSRDAVAAVFEDDPNLYGNRVIQPAYDFTAPFPVGLRSYDVAANPGFDQWAHSNAVKELRMYGFHSPTCTAVFPVARALESGDQWFFVDPDTVPQELFENTQRAIAKAAEVTAAPAVYGTLDFGYGTDGIVDPGWHAIELNARTPYLVGNDKHAQVADALRELLADQIQATAHSQTQKHPIH